MTTIDSRPETELLLQVDVEVRGNSERITWSDGRVLGDERLIARLAQTATDLSDAAGFLMAIRSCFGEAADIRTNVDDHCHDDDCGHS
ncbi:MAG: hypothetical protein WBF71_06185 [Microthrixaceae bacterium]